MASARTAAAALERGALDGRVTRAIAAAVGPVLVRGLVRPARVPEHLALVCVGGATIGGSGKSRVANACARALDGAVIVGHGFRARDRRARFVEASESVGAAGDEALVAARAGLRVVIGPTRQAAIDFAARHARVLILDGPLRISHPPRRAISLLAVDALEPWGSGRVLPAGDLRAPRSALVAAADEVAFVRRAVARISPPRPFGLFTALARPDRIVRALADVGLRPDVVISAPDHGPAPAAVRTAEVAAWVATPKCALHLESLNLSVPTIELADTYMGCLDRVLLRRIVSSLDS